MTFTSWSGTASTGHSATKRTPSTHTHTPFRRQRPIARAWCCSALQTKLARQSSPSPGRGPGAASPLPGVVMLASLGHALHASRRARGLSRLRPHGLPSTGRRGHSYHHRAGGKGGIERGSHTHQSAAPAYLWHHMTETTAGSSALSLKHREKTRYGKNAADSHKREEKERVHSI